MTKNTIADVLVKVTRRSKDEFEAKDKPIPRLEELESVEDIDE